MLYESSNAWPKTSIFEMAEGGIPLHKLVIGKPATEKEAANGYIDTKTLATCLQQAKKDGWSAF